MGLADRDYYRNRPSGRWSGPRGVGVGRLSGWSVNTWIIVINVAIFLIQGTLPRTFDSYGPVRFPFFMDPLEAYGHFSTTLGFLGLEVWRLVTFQFLHANFVHLFFNMFGLFIFGSIVEQFLGSRRYLAFYMICGIFGGLAYLLLNLLGTMGVNLPGALHVDRSTPLIGASAGVFGVIVACAYIAPNAIVQLILPPVPLRLKWFAYGYVGIALANLLLGGNNAGGDAAHVGGAVAGFFFIRNAHLLTDFFDIFKDSRKPPAPRARARSAPAADDAEIDRILAKVGTQGIHSLTETEKRALRARTDQDRRRRA
ncbi:MAG: rhomboid family intramembrane serine protease [Phycisphaerales bacterium JB039]